AEAGPAGPGWAPAHPPALVLVPSLSVQSTAPEPAPARAVPLLADATKMRFPSFADPHCIPPVMPGGTTCVFHTSSPVLRLNAQNIPLFWPAPTRPLSSNIGPCAKSKSGSTLPGVGGTGNRGGMLNASPLCPPHAQLS